jgi:hypothetical protein
MGEHRTHHPNEPSDGRKGHRLTSQANHGDISAKGVGVLFFRFILGLFRPVKGLFLFGTLLV